MRNYTSLDPKLASAWAGLSRALRHEGEWEDAKRARDRAIEIDPKLNSAFLYKGHIRFGAVKKGLVITSIPEAAQVYFMLESDAPASGRIHQLPGAKPVTGQWAPSVQVDGNYVVEVELPIRNRCLKRFPNYLEFRRKLEQASPKERNALARDYFLDDGAEVLVDEYNAQHYIVRQYRSVEVRRGRSNGVRALFLPRITDDNGDLLLDEIIKYVPSPHRYLFDMVDVEFELKFREVPRKDWPALIEALARVGTISYRVPNGNMRLFAINIHDGSFSDLVLGR